MKNFIFAFLFCVALPTLAADKLKNGAPFFGEKDASLPRNILFLSFQAGPATLSPEQQGTLQILKEVLKEGPAGQSLSDFKQQLFRLSAEINSGSGPNVFEISVKAPPAEQEKVLQLLKQTIENPKLTPEDYQRLHGKVLAGLRANFEDMRTVLFYFGPRDFMNYSPQTRTGDTSPTSFEKLSYEDFKGTVPSILNFQRLFVSYVGPEPVATAKKHVETVFAEQLKKPYQPWKVEKRVMPKLEKSQYTIIDKPGATDNQFMYIFPQLVQRDQPEWAVASTSMDTLGGGLHGRLGQVLRTERGLTYGAMSRFSSNFQPFWYVWTFGGLDQTKGLLEGVPEVIENYKKSKMKPAELAESKSRLQNDHKTSTELPQDKLRMMGWFYANGFSANLADRFLKDLDKVSLNAATKFRTELQSKNVALYMMGDKSKILPLLEAQGIKPDTVRIIQIKDIK